MRNMMRKLEEISQLKGKTPYRTRREEMLSKLCPSLREKVLKALAGFRIILGNDLDDFQKISLLYQMICAGGSYDHGIRKRSLSHSFLGALQGLAVCAGFADLFVLLVGDLTEQFTPYRISGYIAKNIESIKENDRGHAWVIIQDKFSKKAWQFDPTWDLGKTKFHYFFKTDNEMKDRIWATKFVPACTEKAHKVMFRDREKFTRLLNYYKSMPQRFISGDFSVG